MKCPYCNSEINDDSLFCSECGSKIEKINTAKRNNEQIILLAIIIALIVIIIAGAAVLIIKGKSANTDVNEANQPQATEAANNEISLNVLEQDGEAVKDAGAEQMPPPVFTEIEVSSTRGTDVSQRTGEVVDYNKSYLMDGIMENCWTPNRHIDSDPYILLRANGMQRVHGVKFADGYFKSQETYNKNRRISRVEILYKGGSVIYECTEHLFGKMQDVVFAAPVDTDFIQIKILDSLYGEWQDICVSEVEVY